MKKVIAIIVFGFLWCNVGFAEIYKMKNCRYNSNQLHDQIGLYDVKINTVKKTITWMSNPGSPVNYESGDIDSGFYYLQKPHYADGTGYAEYTYSPLSGRIDAKVYIPGLFNKKVKYNAKHSDWNTAICEKSKIQTSKIEIASMIDRAKDTCKSLGFTAGTEKFADCSLKLYSQSVELAAEQNKTVVMQPQSSGSNVMTIYDPVRDNQRLIDQGMKMLSGRCTLGYDC